MSEGFAQRVLVVFIDIRDFSRFSSGEEASDLAVYLKHTYRRVIEDYFPNAYFYKSTGDGLLIIIDCPESDLKKIVPATVNSSLKLTEDFPRICKDVDAVNFSTPDALGIAIGRGSCCSLRAGRDILDYSGKLINATARLLDLARPKGVVLDDRIGVDLLSPKKRALFQKHDVYLRGIAERHSLPIWASGDVVIPERRKLPIVAEKWEKLSFPLTIAQMRHRNTFYHNLPKHPIKSTIQAKCKFPKYAKGVLVTGIASYKDVSYTLENHADTAVAAIDYKTLLDSLIKSGCKDTDSVTVSIAFQPLAD